MASADKDIAGYLEHLQTQRKLSAHTLDNYRRTLNSSPYWSPRTALYARLPN